MTHTPGPWRIGKGYGAIVSSTPVEDGLDGGNNVEAYGGHLICESVAPCNMRLISAAPDLLEALKELRKQVPPYSLGSALLGKVDDAIARAEGTI